MIHLNLEKSDTEGLMSHPKSLVLIPARYESTRFPGKPLSKILGKSMIQRVFENLNSDDSFDVYVVTDSEKIEEHIKGFGGQVVRVDDDVISGTERVYLAFERFFKNKNYKLIVIVQGDEPLLKASTLKLLQDFHLGSDYEITTLVRARDFFESDFKNENCVKAITTSSGQCLYFSRSPIPYMREKEGKACWHQHIGVYSFTPSSLESFCKLSPSENEKVECLEQLRALDNGMRIGAIRISEILIGVDTPEDIKRVEEIIGE